MIRSPMSRFLLSGAALLALCISPLSQAGDKPLIQAGKKTLFQRVLTTPGCKISPTAGGAAGDPQPVFSRFYVYERAAVDNRRVAAGLGLPVGRLFLLTFSLGSGLAGLGGALGLGLLALDPYFALRHLAVVLMVVCVGGAGSVAGPFVAAMGVGIVDVAGRYWLPQAGSVPVYATLVAVLLWKPQGLARRRNGA